MRSTTFEGARWLCIVLTAWPCVASAQNAPAAPSSGGDDGAQVAPSNAPPGSPSVMIIPGPAGPSYPGSLPPPGWNPDSHLPSSARSSSDISRSTDGFDLVPKSDAGNAVRGNASGQFIPDSSYTPDSHRVRRGETLWELSRTYYQNPYQWPRLWANNPQIQNPHWIYPGDQVRLRDGNVTASVNRVALGNRRAVPAGTVFLREFGWVDDRTDDVWGELVGSPSDKMMLSADDEVYLQIGSEHEVSVGDEFTLFRPVRTVESERAKGELVSIRGTARIERYNSKTHIARAHVTEALDVIERGVKVGPVGRKFDIIPPIPSDVDLEASVLASVYPVHFYGQNQVVFIDRGEKEGVKPGMRFFAVLRGDPWAEQIHKAGSQARLRARVEDDRPARVDPLPTGMVDDDLLPDETFAELRVARVRAHTAAAIVVHSKHEIERNVRLVARKGY